MHRNQVARGAKVRVCHVLQIRHLRVQMVADSLHCLCPVASASWPLQLQPPSRFLAARQESSRGLWKKSGLYGKVPSLPCWTCSPSQQLCLHNHLRRHRRLCAALLLTVHVCRRRRSRHGRFERRNVRRRPWTLTMQPVVLLIKIQDSFRQRSLDIASLSFSCSSCATSCVGVSPIPPRALLRERVPPHHAAQLAARAARRFSARQ